MKQPKDLKPGRTGDEDAFLMVAHRQLKSSDFDTEHPVWLKLIGRYSIDADAAVWLSFLYMAYYDEASAWATFNQCDPWTVPTDVKYPIGTNRRNLFGGKIVRHLEDLVRLHKAFPGWPAHDFTGNPRTDWDRLRVAVGQAWGNGRFGVYTTAEMLQKVNGLPVEVTGFDNDNSSGPADGIRRVYGCDGTIPELDKHTERAHQCLLASRLKPTYTALDRGVTESLLCNYGGMCRGKFYSGRNIDRQQERILRVERERPESATILAPLWDIRQEVFRPEDLGELNGWTGIDRDRLTKYKETGEPWWTHEHRS